MNSVTRPSSDFEDRLQLLIAEAAHRGLSVHTSNPHKRRQWAENQRTVQRLRARLREREREAREERRAGRAELRANIALVLSAVAVLVGALTLIF